MATGNGRLPQHLFVLHAVATLHSWQSHTWADRSTVSGHLYRTRQDGETLCRQADAESSEADEAAPERETGFGPRPVPVQLLCPGDALRRHGVHQAFTDCRRSANL